MILTVVSWSWGTLKGCKLCLVLTLIHNIADDLFFCFFWWNSAVQFNRCHFARLHTDAHATLQQRDQCSRSDSVARQGEHGAIPARFGTCPPTDFSRSGEREKTKTFSSINFNKRFHFNRILCCSYVSACWLMWHNSIHNDEPSLHLVDESFSPCASLSACRKLFDGQRVMENEKSMG